MRRKAIPNMGLEKELWKTGFSCVAGVDEVGRGAWAGPVVAAAVILPELKKYFGINDSKLLTGEQREKIWVKICQRALGIGIGIVENDELDTMGVGQATQLAMQRAVNNLPIKPDFILVDGFKVKFVDVPSQGVVKGDGKSVSIGAASIVAKVARDRMMCEIAKECFSYAFEINKGYGTTYHQTMIAKYGVSMWHRKSFAPVRKKFEAEQAVLITD